MTKWELTDEELVATGAEAYDSSVGIEPTELRKVAQAQTRKLGKWLEEVGNEDYDHVIPTFQIELSDWQELKKRIARL